MKRYPILHSKGIKIAFAVYVCALMFLTRDSLFATHVLDFYTSQFLFLGLLGIWVLYFLIQNRKQIPEILRDRRVPWAIVCGVILLLPMAVKGDWQLMYFSVLICLYLAIFFTYFVTYQEVAGYFVVGFCALCVYSVIATYLLRIPADKGILVPPIFYRTWDINFYNYGLSYVSIWYVKNRNFGWFREPGVYQYYLMLAIYLTNYCVAWKKSSHMWIANGILAVTMLSTFATGGFIELALFIVIWYFDKQWHKTKKGRQIAAAAIVLLLVVLAAIVIQHGELYNELYLTFIKFFNKSDSITDRVGSIGGNLKLFLAHPIFGNGISETLTAIDNNTSSSLILYAVFGIVGGTLNVAAWFALVWDWKRNVIFNLVLLAILAMSFNTQNLITDCFFWLFPIMAATERVLPLVRIPRIGGKGEKK